MENLLSLKKKEENPNTASRKM